MNQVIATVIDTIQLAHAHFISIEAPDIADKAMPGQFVMVACGGDTILRRPLSIHSIDYPGKLNLLFVTIGEGTNHLGALRKGDVIDILGPLGNGFSIKPDSQNLLLIAGGIGVSPLVFLAHRALQQKKHVTLILGARSKAQLYLHKLTDIGLEIVTLTDDGSQGIKGKISDCLTLMDYVNNADQIFVCGPLPMFKAINSLLHPIVTQRDIQVSLEIRMGCGIGACYGCSIRTKQGMKKICHEGPVFSMRDILWEEIKL